MIEPVPDEEHKIFEAVLRAAYVRRAFFGLLGPHRPELLVVRQKAKTFITALVASIPEEKRQARLEEEIASWNREFAALSPDTVTDFVAKAETDGLISEPFDLPVTCKVLTVEEHDQIWKKGGRSSLDSGWSAFRAMFPMSEGLISFSRAGVGQTGTQALVEVGKVEGSLCGFGRMFLLSRFEGSWRVIESTGTWIS